MDTWLQEYKKPSVRPVPYDSYATMIRYHLRTSFGHIPLKDLRPDMVQRFYNDKRNAGLSPRTVRYLHTIIHGALKQALKNQLVTGNVSEATTLPGGNTRKMRPLSLEEVHQFLAAMKDDPLFPAMFLELGTGVRRGELLGLRWYDLDLDVGVLHVRQTLVRVGNHDATEGDRKTQLIFQEPKPSSPSAPFPSRKRSSKC